MLLLLLLSLLLLQIDGQVQHKGINPFPDSSLNHGSGIKDSKSSKNSKKKMRNRNKKEKNINKKWKKVHKYRKNKKIKKNKNKKASTSMYVPRTFKFSSDKFT